ncbi:MAG: hypothetical protein WC755_08505 [Candidatus Woesearchaeota archaeon]|jgi:hypothetical protein
MSDIQENAFFDSNENLVDRFDEDVEEMDEEEIENEEENDLEENSFSLIDFNEDYDYDENDSCFFEDEEILSIVRHGIIWNIIGFTKNKLYILQDPQSNWIIFVNDYDIDDNQTEKSKKEEHSDGLFEL